MSDESRDDHPSIEARVALLEEGMVAMFRLAHACIGCLVLLMAVQGLVFISMVIL